MASKKIKGLFWGSEPDQTETLEDEFYDVPRDTISKEEGMSMNSNQMILLEPRAYSESQQIADHLKRRNSVVVNLKRVTSDQAKRIIDFLSGCVYSINGTMQKVGVGIYLCAPNNISVQGQISEEQDKGVENSDDEVEW